MSDINKLKQEFDKIAEISSQLTTDLQDQSRSLSKNQILRVFLGAMEYPVPPTKKLASQEEVDIYQMAVGLKEMQMKMGVINLAMKEQESKNGDESESLQGE